MAQVDITKWGGGMKIEEIKEWQESGGSYDDRANEIIDTLLAEAER